MRNTIYGSSTDFIKQFKLTNPGTVAAWLNYLPGSISNEKWVKEVVCFQIVNVMASFCTGRVGIIAVLQLIHKVSMRR